jgi:hypothetical protein
MAFDILARTAALSPTNLTLREVARLEQNPNDLRWPGIFPRVPADSTSIRELSTVDFRPLGGRREWNADGREIIEVLGPLMEAEMVPINPTRHLDEYRMQKLRERAGGFAQLIDAGIVKDVDQWSTALADAADRQIEYDAFRGWFYNSFTVMDPKTGSTTTVALGIASSRYVAAGTTLAAATNAYLDFIGYARAARAALGSLGGVRFRQAALDEILADAPAFSGDRMTLAGLRQRMNDEGFGNFQFMVDERTYDTWTDGGSAYTQAYYVPADRMAFQPANGRVGSTFFAPVTRAYDYIDRDRVRNIQNFTIFYSSQNDGKTLKVEAQANAISLPREQDTYVVTGIA